MRNVNKDFHFFVPDPHSKLQRFKTLRHDPELLRIKQKLLDLNLWEDPSIQRKYRLADLGTERTSKQARVELLELVEDYKVEAMELDDAYMPYASEGQISNGGRGIYVLDQVNNNIPMNVSPDVFLLDGLILGRQGGGKSFAAFNIIRQLEVPMLILDPKCSWRLRAQALNAQYKDCPAFDLDPPDNTTWEDWLFAMMEAVAQATGLQFGLDPLLEASQIALAQRQEYIERTGENTSLCLKDIQLALPLCSFPKSKRVDYKASAQTALNLLVGPENNHLFATRSGLPLGEIFKGNYIISCPYLNTFQSRFLGLYLFLYRYHGSRGLPETNQLKNLIVIDDASRFISKTDSIFGSGSKFGAWMHILSVLRSSGTGALFIDQLVEPISNDVKQLSHFWLVVGGIRGKGNQDEIAAAMSLNREQAEMLGRLKTRECICFCPAAYPYPVHGEIPMVT